MVSNMAPPDRRQGLCISKPSCFWGNARTKGSGLQGRGTGLAGRAQRWWWWRRWFDELRGRGTRLAGTARRQWLGAAPGDVERVPADGLGQAPIVLDPGEQLGSIPAPGGEPSDEAPGQAPGCRFAG